MGRTPLPLPVTDDPARVRFAPRKWYNLAGIHENRIGRNFFIMKNCGVQDFASGVGADAADVGTE